MWKSDVTAQVEATAAPEQAAASALSGSARKNAQKKLPARIYRKAKQSMRRRSVGCAHDRQMILTRRKSAYARLPASRARPLSRASARRRSSCTVARHRMHCWSRQSRQHQTSTAEALLERPTVAAQCLSATVRCGICHSACHSSAHCACDSALFHTNAISESQCNLSRH